MDTTAESVDQEAISGEVVVAMAAEHNDEIVKRPDFNEFLTSSASRDGDAEMDPYERILAQIMMAETPDAVLTPIEAGNLADYVGVNLWLHGFELNKSEFDVGAPFYASMAIVDPRTNEPIILNCGHKKVLAQLVKLQQFNQFPYQIMPMTRGTSKVGGTAMLELRKWAMQDGPPF